MPDQAFRSLFAETENVRWEPMSQVRVRARHRTIAQSATVAGIIALALVSGGVAVAQVRQGPVTPPVATSSPSPSEPSPSSAPFKPSPAPSAPALPPSTSPTAPLTTNPVPSPTSPESSPPVTGITSAMMLRPQDVGSGYTVVPTSGGDWTFEFNASALSCPRGSKPNTVAERERTLRKGEPQDENFVIQHTGRYVAGKAAQYLDDIRERVTSCSPREGQSVRIAAQGFAGDESVLVVFDHGGGFLAKILLVRKGDVLTEIYTKPTRSDAANRELGRKAASRF